MIRSAAVEQDEPAPVRTPEQDAAVRAAGLWVNHLARTLKTCRLYDANNPTVIRFREELAQALTATLEQHGALVLHFTSDDVLCDECSLYPARSRDDNLALAFYRDGIHTLSFSPGVTLPEVETVLDAILRVTGQNAGEDDLVTLLWEAHLPHVDLDYVPAEGDVGVSEMSDAGDPMPWPGHDERDGGGEAGDSGGKDGEDGEDRAEDWEIGEYTVEVEAGFAELEVLAPAETLRFLDEYQAEHEVPLQTATIAIAGAFLDAGAGPADHLELARFLPHVLRQAIAAGAWHEARHCVALLRRCGGQGEWTPATLVEELFQPPALAAAVERLDQQDAATLATFVALARDLGDAGLDWLNLALAESQQRRTRRVLAEAIAQLCREQPERLAPWLADPRWYVVRNIVHILGWIGGDRTLGMLETAMRHPEPRVRQEVIAALGQADSERARTLLLGMLEGADPRTFCSVLHQLSLARDARTARALMTHLADPAFEQRPLEVRRAVFSALAATGGDEILVELEQALYRGSWFSRSQDAQRLAIARCIARVGTPTAQAILERGARSRRAPVRKVCLEAQSGGGDRG